MKKTLKERFWEKVDKNGPIFVRMPYLGRCWVWTANTSEDGYGQIKEGSPSRKQFRAHRLSYEMHQKRIPEGLCVLHKCDNPPCVNPEHLFVGTRKDNSDDMEEKGRAVHAKGESHGSAKLTEEKISEIRRDYVRGSRTHGQPALARKYDVNQTTIGVIVRRKTW